MGENSTVRLTIDFARKCFIHELADGQVIETEITPRSLEVYRDHVLPFALIGASSPEGGA
jgi:hypothetical protein